jgi:large subunit ribosomal protein L32e
MKFLRTNTREYKRLGRKKLRRWRMPKGRHNKIREHVRGKPAMPTIGFQKPMGKKVFFKVVRNLKDIEKVGKGSEVIIAHVGKKNRERLLAKAKEKSIEVLN